MSMLSLVSALKNQSHNGCISAYLEFISIGRGGVWFYTVTWKQADTKCGIHYYFQMYPR